jgi:hypothetical protein
MPENPSAAGKSMKYVPYPHFSKDEIMLALSNPDDGDAFSEALASAAMFLQPEDFDACLGVAVRQVRTPENQWAIAVAIQTVAQARRILPTNAEEILLGIPDGELTSPSRDGALEVIALMRASGRFVWPNSAPGP